MANRQAFPVDPQLGVDHFLLFAGSPGFPDVVLDPFGGRHDQCAVAVGFQTAAEGSPCAFVSRERKGVLGPAQEVVGEHGDPDVRAAAPGELVVEGVQAEVAFHAAEGVFHPNEGDVEFPQLLVFEFKGAAEVVAAVQLAAVVPFGFLALPAEFPVFVFVADFIEPGGAGGPPEQATDDAVDESPAAFQVLRRACVRHCPGWHLPFSSARRCGRGRRSRRRR